MTALTAIVAGGAGQVGEGIVRVLLESGARVIAPTRSAERAALLRSLVPAATVDRLRTDVVDVGRPAAAQDYAASLARDGVRPGLVVASLGGWWGGSPLHEMDPEAWSGVVADNLTSHFAVARAFSPALLANGGGAYVLVNGAAALQPVPGSGVISIVAAAQIMLHRVLSAELAPRVGVYQVMIAGLVGSPRSRWGVQPGSISPDDVGRAVLGCVGSPPPSTGTTVTLGGRH